MISAQEASRTNPVGLWSFLDFLTSASLNQFRRQIPRRIYTYWGKGGEM